MIQQTLPSIPAWIAFIETVDLPILAQTRSALQQLHANLDDVGIADLVLVIQHDALAALHVLRFLQAQRRGKPRKDVASIEGAALMAGMMPVLNECMKHGSVEALLAQQSEAQEAVLRVLQRSHLAATCAGVWAARRHDIDTHEVVTAALLHDLAEVIVGCVAPSLLLQIRNLQAADPHLRSHQAQTSVLGFALIDLQLALIEQWHLPEILKTLMDDHHCEHPRVRTVSTAAAFARHVAHGWDDLALPDDYAAVAQICSVGAEEARRLAIHAALDAARDWRWYGTLPAATLLAQTLPPLEHTAG